MAQRFEKLFTLPPNLYSEGSPVIISAGSLLKDTETGKIVIQIKFHSVSFAPIKALKVGIAAFDIAGKEIDGVPEYQYLDLSIQNGQEFGSNKAIVMPNLVTRSFSIKSITVVLVDGHIQSVSMPLSSLPQPVVIHSVLKDAELIKQFKLKTNEGATYVPQESLGLWQCHCGEWNSCSGCSRCKGQKSAVFTALDLPSLTNEMNSRLAEEAQRKAEAEWIAEIDRQEKEKQLAKKQEEEERKRKRNTKIAKIAAIILTPAIIGILLWNYWLLPNVIQPSRAYSEAEQLLADGYYSDAATVFEALGDYKDSPARLEEAVTYIMDDIYEYGIQLMYEGNYESAIVQFEDIVNYKDASKKIEEAKTAILEDAYLEAEKLLESGLYEDSIQAFTKILNYRDSQNRITEAKERWNESIYNQACQLAENGDSISAAMMFGGIPDYSDASKRSLELWNQFAQRNTIYEGDTTLAITSDGCVLAAAYNSRGEHNVQFWRNIVDVAAAWHVSFGLTAAGEVLSTSKDWGDFSAGEWKNIVDIEGGYDSIIGLKADGTVVAQGDNEWGECNVSHWTDVISIKSNGLTTVGLRKDGTILICGNKAGEFRECLNWTGIIQIATDGQHLVGLKADGTVMTVGNNEYGQCDLTRWHDVVFVDAGSFFTIGLQSDGTVLYAGLDKYGGSESTEWKGIIGIEAGNHVCIGLMPDGTLVIVGDDSCKLFDEIRTWKNIRLPK